MRGLRQTHNSTVTTSWAYNSTFALAQFRLTMQSPAKCIYFEYLKKNKINLSQVENT